MHFSTSAFVTALVASVVRADYIIDPDSVSASDRAYWCQNQISSCPIICNQVAEGDTKVNECDPDTLTYGCICSNGVAPNMSEYTLTLPYHTCQAWGNQCVKACGQDNDCSNSCRVDHPCGAQTPKPSNATTTSSDSASKPTSSSDSADALHTNTLGGGNQEGAAIRMGSTYGIFALTGALFAGFAML